MNSAICCWDIQQVQVQNAKIAKVVYICFALLVLFNMLLAMVLDSYGAAAQASRASTPNLLSHH